MDSTQLVNDLIAITTRLVMVMSVEIQNLRAHDIKSVESLQSDKAALARAYETLIRELRKHPCVLQDVAPALRDELVTCANDFQRLLVENEAALRAAKDVNARVLKAIADAVTDSRKETANYSRTGAVDLGKPGHGAAPVSMTLDRTL